MKITTKTRKEYDDTAKGSPFLVEVAGRKVRQPKDYDGPAVYRCPVRIEGIVTLRFKDGGLTRGRLPVQVVAIQRLSKNKFLVRLERAGTKHRPIPAPEANLLLARKAGYTANASISIDRTAPSMDRAAAERVMHDTQVKHRAPKSEIADELRKAPDAEDVKDENPERVAAIEAAILPKASSGEDDLIAA